MAPMGERWPADAAHVRGAADRLRRGAVIAFPTDTLYAVGARARDPIAVQRLYRAKQRPATQPMVWLVTGRDQVEPDAVVTQAAGDLMRKFWPGPLTLVLPARAQPDGTTIAVRAPDHEVALTLLRSLGEPIASSSANPAGRPPPLDADQVIAGMGDRIDLVLDGGPCRIGQPSTILDLSGQLPRILRQGAIPETDLITP
jgi:L-threonylcarbamoyladenylate synthase